MADQAIQAAKAASAPDGTGTFLSSAAPPPELHFADDIF